MNIGEAAKLSGLPAKTLRYYEQIGLVVPSRRSANGYRDYSEEDVQVLRFVRRARAAGFGIHEVRELLALWRDPHRTAAEVKRIASKRLRELERRIRELEAMKRTLERLVEACHGEERPECPILDGLAAEGAAPAVPTAA